MNTDLMFSSEKMDWTTPQDFYEKLNQEFHFTLDQAASAENAKCSNYYTEADDGLSKDWSDNVVFCNPPYGRQLPKWIEKCYYESQKPNTTVVMLIPARTDTKAFHTYIYHKAEIRFIKGRLKFGDGKNSAPFPSMVVIMRGDDTREG